MHLIKRFFINFFNRGGSYIIITTILSRLFSFLASWIALQFIDNNKLGVTLYAWNIITFLLPFIGFGLHQSFLRYGALISDSDKNALLHYVKKKGVFTSIILSFLVSFFALLYPFKFEKTGIYLALFSLSFIPTFLFCIIQIKFRLQHKNKLFAFSELVYTLLLVILVFLLSYLYQEKGYAAALILAPTLASILYFKNLIVKKDEIKKLKIIDKEFWKYGFFGGLANVSTILLFSIDILLIGSILNNSDAVTSYRYVSLIPISLLFIQRAFIKTDFVAFTEKIHDKTYIKEYCKSYILIFCIISIIICGVVFLFSEDLLSIFDNQFVTYKTSFRVLTIGICGILILRGLFGNLLSSIGEVKINYYITSSALVINIISNYYLIPKYQLLGAAITSASMMWFTGILSAILFYYKYKKQLIEKTK